MSKHWSLVPLREILIKSENWIELKPSERYKQVTVKIWGKGVIERNEVTGAEISASKRLQVKSGQFIVSRIDARHGAFGLIPDSLDGAVVTNDFPVFTPNFQRILPQFLGWMSKTANFVEICKAASEGTTNRVRLKEDHFLAMEILLPPLEEQRRIVARVEELALKIEEARSLRQQALNETEALVPASARKLLSEVNTELTELGRWLEPNLDGIQTGPFGAQLGSLDFLDAGVPVLTIGNIQYNGLKIDGLKFVSELKAQQLKRYVVREGDILFARMGTVGRCCVAPAEAQGWLFNYHIIRVALDKQRVDPRFIHWTIRASADVENYLSKKIRGATREGVNSKIVRSLPCRVPPLPEQRRIVAYLDNFQVKVDEIKRLREGTMRELDAMLPSILDKAFKGEL